MSLRPNRPVKTLPLSVRISWGTPWRPHRGGEMRADGPARRSGHHPGAHDEPGVVIDPGEHLALPPVGQQHPADHVHLPQLHRPAPLPPLELAVPRRRAPDRSVRRASAPDTPPSATAPGSTPPATASCTSRRGPQSGLRRRASQHPHLDRPVHLMRAPRRRWDRSASPPGLVLIPPQPPVHRLARHAEPARHLHDRNTIADHREHRLIPLLHDTQLHQHARECVTDQAEPPSPSGEAVSRISRSRCVKHQAEPNKSGVARRAGFEPATHGLGVRCSIR